MSKELLRMQMLAGIITEGQYKQLLEDEETINRILDKISDKGIGSLEPEEKEYLDRHSKGEKNLLKPISGPTEVYVGEPYSELYKIENFPAMGRPEDVTFNCNTKATECEDYPKYQELIKNPKFKYIIDKIHKNEKPFILTQKVIYFFMG